MGCDYAVTHLIIRASCVTKTSWIWTLQSGEGRAESLVLKKNPNSPAYFDTIWWTLAAREQEGTEKQRGCRQYGGSPHLIHSVNNTDSVNYIWVVAKQGHFLGVSPEYLSGRTLSISKHGARGRTPFVY